MTHHTDRELLELAATAADIDHEGYTEHFFDPECYGSIGLVVSRGGVAWLWNPLTDDGDAFRLACDLGLLGNMMFITSISRIQRDDYATTRRAVVLAAAEIVAAL